MAVETAITKHDSFKQGAKSVRGSAIGTGITTVLTSALTATMLLNYGLEGPVEKILSYAIPITGALVGAYKTVQQLGVATGLETRANVIADMINLGVINPDTEYSEPIEVEGKVR